MTSTHVKDCYTGYIFPANCNTMMTKASITNLIEDVKRSQFSLQFAMQLKFFEPRCILGARLQATIRLRAKCSQKLQDKLQRAVRVTEVQLLLD